MGTKCRDNTIPSIPYPRLAMSEGKERGLRFEYYNEKESHEIVMTQKWVLVLDEISLCFQGSPVKSHNKSSSLCLLFHIKTSKETDLIHMYSELGGWRGNNNNNKKFLGRRPKWRKMDGLRKT